MAAGAQFAATESQQLAERQFPRHFLQRLAPDQPGAKPAQGALVGVGVRPRTAPPPITRPSTASPRNSSRSLFPPLALRWVSASSSRPSS